MDGMFSRQLVTIGWLTKIGPLMRRREFGGCEFVW